MAVCGGRRVATLQENNAGVPWIEDVVKRFLSGEYIACRALFGKSTELFSWARCVKYLEWNRTYPSIRGDWRNMQSLRAWWRRLVAVLETLALRHRSEVRRNLSRSVQRLKRAP